MSAEPIAVLRSRAGPPVPLQGVDLTGRAEGLLFELTVEQRYVNAERQAIEAVYTFPLSLGAVLLEFELRIGERRIKGQVTRKREAAERYETALEAGHSAALLERARDGLYTVNIGNLLPGETATIRYRYAQLLDFEQGRVRLAIPTAVAPRYGDPTSALAVYQRPDVDLAAHYPCTFALELRGPLARALVHSPTHRVEYAARDGVLVVSSVREFSLDRELVVLVENLAESAQTVLARDGQGYVAVASLTAPKGDSPRAPQALKLVVDCSGSMAGDSIGQAREALLGMLPALEPHDHVSLTRFGSTVVQETEGLEPASTAVLTRINGRVRALEADLGGTELGRALVAATALPVPPGRRADVLLITDGEIWQIDKVVAQVARENHRLFVVAVGAAPVEELARRVAEVTGGACEFVTPGEDIRAAVLRLMARAGTAPRKVSRVDWPAVPTWTLGEGTVVFPGDTVHVLAGFAVLPKGEVHVQVAGGGAERMLEARLPESAASEDTLARVGATRRLKRLAREEAAALAVGYQLVTEYTSCVVVLERAEGEQADGLPALRTVPQELAAGWGGTGRVSHIPPRLACPMFMADELNEPSFSVRSENDCAHSVHYYDPEAFTLEPSSFATHSSPAIACGGGRVSTFTLEPSSFATHSAGDRQADARSHDEAIFSRIRTWREQRSSFPTRIEELRSALGIEEPLLAELQKLVDEGLDEGEVVLAWLVLFAERFAAQWGGGLEKRERIALERKVERGVLRRVEGVVAAPDADTIPF